jgi:hypothetical protein
MAQLAQRAFKQAMEFTDLATANSVIAQLVADKMQLQQEIDELKLSKQLLERENQGLQQQLATYESQYQDTEAFMDLQDRSTGAEQLKRLQLEAYTLLQARQETTQLYKQYEPHLQQLAAAAAATHPPPHAPAPLPRPQQPLDAPDDPPPPVPGPQDSSGTASHSSKAKRRRTSGDDDIDGSDKAAGPPGPLGAGAAGPHQGKYYHESIEKGISKRFRSRNGELVGYRVQLKLGKANLNCVHPTLEAARAAYQEYIGRREQQKSSGAAQGVLGQQMSQQQQQQQAGMQAGAVLQQQVAGEQQAAGQQLRQREQQQERQQQQQLPPEQQVQVQQQVQYDQQYQAALQQHAGQHHSHLHAQLQALPELQHAVMG